MRILFSVLAASAALAILPAPASAETSYDVLDEVHRDVNSSVRFRDDRKRGRDFYDSWDIPGRFGDCEDYALLKKQRLIELGWDPEDLQLLIVARRADAETSREHSRDGRTVVFLHVVLYVPSLGVILDSTSPASQLSGRRNQSTPILPYERWMQNEHATLYCVVADETLGDDIRVQDRCAPRS